MMGEYAQLYWLLYKVRGHIIRFEHLSLCILCMSILCSWYGRVEISTDGKKSWSGEVYLAQCNLSFCFKSNQMT
jgi:hypothetical protein